MNNGSSYYKLAGKYFGDYWRRGFSEKQSLKVSEVSSTKTKDKGMRKVIEYIAVLSFLLLLILLFAGLFLYMFRSFFYTTQNF